MRSLALSTAAAVLLGSCCPKTGPTAQPVEPVAQPVPPEPEVDPPPPPAPARPYPATRRDAVVDTLHGVAVADPYRWLEDETAPEVATWMTTQDDAARAALAAYPGRDAIAARLREVFYFDAVGAPTHAKGRYFWTRKHADKEKNVVYWKAGERGAERVLFDPNTWSTDGSAGLGGWWPSRDGRYVAYAKKLNNADESEMFIRDVDADRDLPGSIPGTKYGGVTWAPDGSGLYYTWVPPIGGPVTIANRPGFAEVRFHRVGKAPEKFQAVYPATGNPKTFVGATVSWDGKWLLATVRHGWNSTDVYVKSTKARAATWQPLVVGAPHIYEVTAWKGKFYVRTNDGAARYRIMVVDPAKPDRASWRELIGETADTLQGASIIGDRLVLSYLRDATSALEVRGLDGRLIRTVALPPLGSVSGLTGNPDEDTAYFTFSSFTEAATVYRTSIASGAVTEWSRVEVPIDTTGMVVEQVRFPSKDGTSIPMFLMRKKDAPRDGTNRVLLFGYGGFNISLTPSFASARAVWVERGGILAIPNLRGGGEFGEAWHQAGMGPRKQNTFDDYLAAARYLIDQRWTTPGRLAIQGGSNGGLLVGAAMTQAPELFGAVICAVPLLDMVRYHQFGSGATWIPEYGSADDPAQFATLHAYSPYHRVVEGTRYPALLMASADHDDRVDPMHARKFVAAVQHATAALRPALLRIERNAGHGGADAVKQAVDQNADYYAFLEAELR
jgi:prolyl oligopeptidase